MKNIISILCLVIWIIGICEAQKIKGSDTVLPLAQREAEDFIKTHPDADISVTGGGSGVGLSALLSGTTDIAMASRRITFGEKMKLQKAGKRITEVVIAHDGLAVIVHPSNKINRLTRKQLDDIFTGKINNWKDVGGDDMKIIAYSRETSSGTYEFFKEKILDNKNYKNGILSLPATGAIIQSIGQTRGAIGYVGLAYLNKEVKPVEVSYDGSTYVAPTLQNAEAGAYPVVRPLYFYYEKSSETKAKPFVDFVLSAEGQKIVSEVGYIRIEY